jgi:hypothetical protein
MYLTLPPISSPNKSSLTRKSYLTFCDELSVILRRVKIVFKTKECSVKRIYFFSILSYQAARVVIRIVKVAKEEKHVLLLNTHQIDICHSRSVVNIIYTWFLNISIC